MPALSRAVDGLKRLSMVDLDEIRSFNHPPESIKTLMEAVCIVLRVEPKRSYDPMTYIKTVDYWSVATGPEVLGHPMILDKLSSLDPDKVDRDVIA